MNALHWRGLIDTDLKPQRWTALVFAAVLSLVLVCMQLGFVPLDPLGVSDLCFVLLLAPVAMGSMLLGTLAGTLLGIWAGTAFYIHALVMPLDFREVLYVNPFNTIVLLGVAGFFTSLFMYWATTAKGDTRTVILRIVLASTLLAALGSAFFSLLPSYDPPILELFLQILLNTVAMALPALGAFAFTWWTDGAVREMGIRQAFSAFIIGGMVLAYLLTVAWSFVSATMDNLEATRKAMSSETNYLCLQLSSNEELADALFNSAPESVVETAMVATGATISRVLNGYTLEQSGTVMLLFDNYVITSDDDRIPLGESLTEIFTNDTIDAIHRAARNQSMERIIYDGVLTLPLPNQKDSQGIQLGYLCAKNMDEWTVVLIQPSSMVFRERSVVVFRETIMAIILLFVVYQIVTRLLVELVVERIEKTNASLDRITSGALDERCEVAGAVEFRALATGINSTVDELNRLIGEAERLMEADLEAARAIQMGSLPRRFPAFPDVDAVDLYASMNAAKEVGGDFYDFFPVDDHTVAFLIADVSGKGIPGALFMMAAKAEIQNYLSTGMGVGKALAAAEAYLCAHNEASMFVTVWAATLDWKTGQLTYVNAGHNFPLIRHGDGGWWEWIENSGNMVMGWFDIDNFREHTLILEPGDELLLYTDGVNEAFNAKGEQYGNDRLETFLNRHNNERPQPLVEDLGAEIAAWEQGAEQSDDITILAVEYRP